MVLRYRAAFKTYVALVAHSSAWDDVGTNMTGAFGSRALVRMNVAPSPEEQEFIRRSRIVVILRIRFICFNLSRGRKPVEVNSGRSAYALVSIRMRWLSYDGFIMYRL